MQAGSVSWWGEKGRKLNFHPPSRIRTSDPAMPIRMIPLQSHALPTELLVGGPFDEVNGIVAVHIPVIHYRTPTRAPTPPLLTLAQTPLLMLKLFANSETSNSDSSWTMFQ